MSKIAEFFEMKSKLGVALGGGGARGIAHIGALKSFEEKKLTISCISGTSAGAFVATLFAFGITSDEIKDIFEGLTFTKISNIFPNKLGLSANLGVADIIRKTIGDKKIEDSKIPLAILCTDLVTGEKKIFTEGPVDKIVQASCSLPGLFSPVKYQDMLLVDGALSENVPVSAIKALGANFILAIRLSDSKLHAKTPTSMLDVLGRSFDILVDNASDHKIKHASHLIYLDLSFMSPFKLSGSERAYELGYKTTQTVLERSLFYWWVKPFSDYIRNFSSSFMRLVKTTLTQPKIRGSLFFSQNYWNIVSKKIFKMRQQK